MKLYLIVVAPTLVLAARPVLAEPLFLKGAFTAKLTNGSTYTGSFRGTIHDADTSRSAIFRSDDFDLFEAQLSPPRIGETLFDESNLEVLVDYRNGRFEQLWFGGDHLGPNGNQEGVDDFFVQWHFETQTPPDTGFFSEVGSTRNVTITEGDLDIFVPEASSWTSALLALVALLNLSRYKSRR